MNPTEAPLHVPVEIRLQGEQAAALPPRWFRLATAISPERVRLRSPLPAELCGARVEVRLRLPPLPGPGASAADPDASRPVLALRALVVDSRDEDQDEADEPRPRRLDLPAPSEADRAAITRYVERRLA